MPADAEIAVLVAEAAFAALILLPFIFCCVCMQPAERALVEITEQAAAVEQGPQLPYFPYAARGGGAPETMECAICLEPLRQGQHCSAVLACRHVFHRECLKLWARNNGSCPLRRAKIAPGSDGVAAAHDTV